MPLILAVSQRSLAAGGVGVTDRASGERRVLSVDEVASSLPRWPEGASDLLWVLPSLTCGCSRIERSLAQVSGF